MGREEHGLKEGRRRRKRFSRRVSLPQELLSDIFVRLAPKSLMRFKSVCKWWRTLISDPYFVESYSRYMEHQKKKNKVPSSTLFLQMIPSSTRIVFYRMNHHKNNSSSFKFSFTKDFPGLLDFWYAQKSMEETYIMTGLHDYPRRHRRLKENAFSPVPIHCKGLLLIATYGHIYVCNPTTREVGEVPPPKYTNGEISLMNLNRVGFGFDHRTNKYKAVWCLYRSCNHRARSYSLAIKVFTLGGGDSDWRQTSEDPPYPVESSYPASIGGAIYWKIDNDLHTSSFKAFLRFGLSDEKFSVIEPPPTPQHNWHNDYHCFTCFTHSEETLCCFIRTGLRPTVATVWTTKDFVTHSWTLAYTITLPEPRMRFRPITIHEGSLLYHYSNGLYWHNPQKNPTDELKVCMDGSTTRFVVEDIYYRATPWVESIVPIMAAPSSQGHTLLVFGG